MAQQKSSRGNGSQEAADNRQNNQLDFITKEIWAILRDVRTGSLPLCEIPGFIAWMMKNGGSGARPDSIDLRPTWTRPTSS